MKDGDLYFAWELARELNQPDPDEMLRNMSARTFAKWLAFHKAERVLNERAVAEAKAKG